MIVTGMDASWLQLYIFFWSVHFAALLLTTVLLLYHINLVIQGKLCGFINFIECLALCKSVFDPQSTRSLLFLFLKGRTTFESNRSISLYNLGWKQNLLEVFGESWKKSVIWPFVRSKLPHNGVDWDTTETWGLEGPKHR